MDLESLKYVKKTQILAQIVTNYIKEKQAIINKDLALFREILQEREKLIDTLGIIQLSPPSTPLQHLQYKQLQEMVGKLKKERDDSRYFFPH